MRDHEELKVCERCGANAKVHEGLCRRCRRILLGAATPLAPVERPTPHQAEPEPLHSPPWRRRGA